MLKWWKNLSNPEFKIHYNKGIKYNDEGKYNLAVVNFEKALECDPDCIEAHFDLGAVYINKKDYDLAIKSFNNVLRLNPNEVTAYVNIALAYLRIGDFGNSIESYKKALTINPEDIDTVVDLAYAYVKNQQYDEAIELYNKAMNYGSHRFKAKEGLDQALNLKGYYEQNKAEKPAEKQVETTEKISIENNEEEIKDHHEHYEIAVNFVKQNDFEAAIENLRKCIRLEPHFTKAKALLDKLYILKEKAGNNLPVKKETLITSPPAYVNQKDLRDAYTIGVCFFNAQNYDMAEEKFRDCLQIDPNHEESQEYLKKISKNKG